MIKRIEAKPTNSRASIHNGIIYFSGHVAAGKQATIKEQARALLSRYDELFAQYGSDKDHIISAVVYLRDINLKTEFNEIWNEWIDPEHAPTRVCVEVGLDEGYLVELALIAELIEEI